MQKHILNYLKHTGYTTSDFIHCEICRSRAVDIHHIIPRSKFGSKEKDKQDQYSNLIALCRPCHEKAHQGRLTEQINNAIKNR